jgi:nucleoside-diphosphate-sugar epimerase
MPPQIVTASPSRGRKGCGPRRSARRARGGSAGPCDGAPERFIARVDPATGRERPGAIRPEELLIHTHRDGHILTAAVGFLGSRVVSLTGSEWLAEQVVRACGRLLPGVAGNGDGHAEAFRFRMSEAGPDESSLRRLREDARTALDRCGGSRLRIFLTGATGFLGQELLAQAALDPHVEEVVCLVRPQVVHGRDGHVRRVGATARGRQLLERLGLGAQAARFRFVAGDVERPGLGLAAAVCARLRRTVTHVVHCAASVSFDAPYADSFRANVMGTRNVLALSLGLQRARGSPFVAHVAVETSYVHGRVGHVLAREGDLAFPPGYYNNYYELTKAMATLETDRAMRRRGLRVVQLLPSIVVGHSGNGNNRGDTKVVNAPVNAFGRARAGLQAGLGLAQRLGGRVAAAAASVFPADGAAELNLVPVDRVVAGVLAALRTPEAVGRRIHLATDRRIRSDQMVSVMREELEVNVRLADPTLARALMLPLARAALRRLGRGKLARSLDRLGAVFGVYSERGQPIHGVGDDVRVLGLPGRRPDTVQVFRMLCRHNRYVQEFGAVKSADEIARRERVWAQAIDEIEFGIGRRAARIPARQFRELLAQRIDLSSFEFVEARP